MDVGGTIGTTTRRFATPLSDAAMTAKRVMLASYLPIFRCMRRIWELCSPGASEGSAAVTALRLRLRLAVSILPHPILNPSPMLAPRFALSRCLSLLLRRLQMPMTLVVLLQILPRCPSPLLRHLLMLMRF